MAEMQTWPISGAATLRVCADPRFKTMRTAVYLLVPMSRATAAKYALLPALLGRASREYPDYTLLGRRLAELYGAGLGSGVQRIGEYQVLDLSVEGIANRYALCGEDLYGELTRLLFSVIFDPLTDGDGLFPAEGFSQEKRQQLEQKDAEFSDKMYYAHQRCRELLFQGLPAGLDRLGSREEIAALRREDLLGAWEELLRQARLEIFVLGNCQPDVEQFQRQFRSVGRPRRLGAASHEARKPCRVVEEQPVAQSKLAMAFHAQAPAGDRLLFQLMSAVLGEPASSKLFQNVREKRGLCYYCDSAFSWTDGALYIESGVEAENLALVEEAALEQLNALQKGRVTGEELEHAKLYLCHSLRSVGDSLHSMESWYLARAFGQEDDGPEQAVERLLRYTVEDVVEAANRLQPAVFYRLKGGAA